MLSRVTCYKCLSFVGLVPYELSWKETALHLVPGLGFFTSAVGSCLRKREITIVDHSIRVAQIASSQLVVAPTQDEAARETLLKNFSLSNDSFRQDRTKREAKQFNCSTLCVINATYSVALTILLVAAYQWGKV